MIDHLIDPLAFKLFDPTAVGFNRNNAWALAQLSNLAYEDDKTIDDTFTAWGMFGAKITSTTNDIRATVSLTDEFILVSFRGTISERDGKIDLNNWKTDADTTQVDLSGYFPMTGHVHQGFIDALMRVWNRVVAAIRGSELNKPVWITGHSLGGALAYLMAGIIRGMVENGGHSFPVQGVYTFGQPRVGDKVFCSHAVPNYHRVVNNADIITRIPRFAPRLPLEFYSHTGELHYFDAAGKLHHGERFFRDLYTELRASTNWRKKLADPIEDHFMSGYLDCLRPGWTERNV